MKEVRENIQLKESLINQEKSQHASSVQQEQKKQREILKDHDIIYSSLTGLINFLKASNKQVENDDIQNYVTQTTNAELIFAKLQQYQSRHPRKNQSLYHLLRTMTGRSFFIGGMLYFFTDLANILGICMLDIVTDNLKVYPLQTDKSLIIFQLVIMISLFYLSSFAQSRMEWMWVVWQAEAQTVVQVALLQKSLKTKQYTSSTQDQENSEQNQPSQQQQQNNGQNAAEADINNMMTVDVELIKELFECFHVLWINIIVIVIIFVLIYHQVGQATHNGFLVLLIAFFVNIILVKGLQWFFERMLEEKDKRISLTNDVIDGMKSIKYLSWEKVFEGKIQSIRKREFRNLFGIRFFDFFSVLFWQSLSYGLMYTFLVNYVDMGYSLYDSNVFTIIALFSFLIFPLGILPEYLGMLFKIYISMKRIQHFLNQAEIDESIVIRGQYDQNQNIQALKIHKLMFKWPQLDTNAGVKQQESQINKSDQDNQNKQEQSQKKLQEPLLISQENKDKPQINNSQEEAFTLAIDDINIPKGKLTFVIGKVGSGKTALINAILNEMDSNKSNDFVIPQQQQQRQDNNLEDAINPTNLATEKVDELKIQIYGKLAIVTQNHWIQNKSIRENILFGQQYEPKKYKKCIEACQLAQDIQTFANQDQKLAGPDGANLSGGQKQRVSLCRALYQNADIYILDDAFSSLDQQVSDQIFQKVIVEMLLAQGKTVVFMTSNYRYIDAQQHNIICLDQGRIIDDPAKVKEQLSYIIQDNQNKEVILDQLDINKDLSIKSRMSYESKSRSEKDKKVDEYDDTEEINEEYREQGNIKFQSIMLYLRAMNVGVWSLMVLFGFLCQVSRSIIDFWLKSEVTPGNDTFAPINDLFQNDFQQTFLFLLSINIAITTLRAFFYILSALLGSYRMFNKLNHSIIYSKMKFFDNNAKGRIIARLSKDILMVDNELPDKLDIFFEYLTFMLGYLCGIIIQLWWLSIVFFALIAQIYTIYIKYRVANRELKRLASVNEGIILSQISETCKGVRVIRAFQKQQHTQDEFIQKLNDLVSSASLSKAIFNWLLIRLLLLGNTILTCVGVTSIIIVIYQLEFDYSTIAMSLSYCILFTIQLQQTVEYLSFSETNLVSIERIRHYLENEQEELNKIDQSLLDQMPLLDEESFEAEYQEDNYSIRFKDVFFSYDSTDQASFKDSALSTSNQSLQQTNQHPKQFALKNFNLKIKKSQKVAICGRTGSGKTTILNVLFRLYPIDKGNVYIHGKNIMRMSLEQLRRQISIIPQFGFLYKASLKDNLDPEGNFEDEIQIQSQLMSSGLKIMKNTEQKNKDRSQCREEEKSGEVHLQQDIDLQTEIEESGSNLSNGEKQIINYWRVLLRNVEIICLDEATSNMDPKTNDLLIQSLFNFTQDKTLLVITHRLEHLEKYDQVVVMDQGEIVEMGHFTELKQKEGGYFHKMLNNIFQ